MSNNNESPASQARDIMKGFIGLILIVVFGFVVLGVVAQGLNVVVPLDKLEAQMCATMAADGTPCE